jgi:Duf34/NIF3 (NGG1p interacting factor 3)
MNEQQLQMTRRTLIKVLAATAAADSLTSLVRAQNLTAPTAVEVVAQIKKHLPMTWNEKSYRDTFKAGDPNTPVVGIACCFMSTLDVLQRANAQGLNFVISHEPTFWTDPDLIEPIKNDPLYLEKLSYIEKNKMVVWRIHDHWHRMVPDPMEHGTENLLGWADYASGPRSFKIPPMKLQALAELVAIRLNSRSVRMLGNPDMVVELVARGSHTLEGNMAALAEADAVISSEVREWDTIEYTRDLLESGARKGLIVIAHEVGEEEGMVLFTNWMQKVTPSIRVENVQTYDRLFLL